MQSYEEICHVRLDFNTFGSSFESGQNVDVEFLDGPLAGVSKTISVPREDIREDHRETQEGQHGGLK